MISSSFLGIHFAVLPFTVRFYAVWSSPRNSGNAGQTFVSLDGSQSCQHCLLKACPFPAAWEPCHCWFLRIGLCFFSGLLYRSLLTLMQALSSHCYFLYLARYMLLIQCSTHFPLLGSYDSSWFFALLCNFISLSKTILKTLTI